MCESCKYFQKLCNTYQNEGIDICSIVKIHLQCKTKYNEKDKYYSMLQLAWIYILL